MRLSDYMREGASSCVAGQREDASLERETQALREALYREMPSERIAQLAALGHERARAELSCAVEQILNRAQPGAYAEAHRPLLVQGVLDMVLGLGPLEELLADPDITEVMANGPQHVFFERDGVIHPCARTFSSEEELRLVVDRIVSPLGRRVDEQSPIVNARLPEGHRVNVVIPPISMEGTALTIRKFRRRAFTLDELVGLGTLSPGMAQLLSWAVRARKNIAVSGGTGGGKTTLLNALSREIPKNERIVTIEDSAELRFDEHPDVVRMEARMANAEGRGEVTIRDLVINALRQRPDRIVVGECRGAEAADMLQAMNTGHDGSLTTLHANSPAEVVPRLVMMVRFGLDLPCEIVESQIASALDLIVQQDRMEGGKRRITQIVARHVAGARAGTGGGGTGGGGAAGSAHGGAQAFGAQREGEMFKTVVAWSRREQRYVWKAFPDWVEALPWTGVAKAEEVARWEQSLHAS